MQDRYQRSLTYLRLSVTDRCNLRCHYCMPAEGLPWLPAETLLQDDEILTLLRDVYVPLGIRRIRLTGGEPLARRGLVDLVAAVAALPEIDDLSLSTNGVLLPELAAPLRQAGLRRLNISLDSLVPETFKAITRGGEVARVLAGIEAALAAGFGAIKLNAVVVPGVNDAEVTAFAALTVDRPLHVRFIEMMPVGNRAYFDEKRVAMSQELLGRISDRYGLVDAQAAVIGNGPALIRRIPGARGTIGFISPMSQSFCHDCNRTRLTANGKIKACLMRPQEQDLLGALRSGATPAQMQALVAASLTVKPWHHDWGQGQEFTRTMSRIGG